MRSLITVFSICFLHLVHNFVGSVAYAHPAVVVLQDPNTHRSIALNDETNLRPSGLMPMKMNKRSFDRFDQNPFSFGAFSKRYNEDDEAFPVYRRKKSVNQQRVRRAFDRIETEDFGLGGFNYGMKRSLGNDAQTLPNRLELAALEQPFRSKPQRLSIAKLLQQTNEIEPSLYYLPNN
ncbi:hypothetical protein M3Y94_00571300 [Aphelenchoides besseyi]|nr:hypothetical protein M3Y94_00571300 [Aphelenchoides besseyi]KAI6218091.1 hypothetical protein M3Y95_01183400 [Aphelenchoides besseyi]